MSGMVVSKPSNLNIASDLIGRLQSEIESLKCKNSALLEQFVIWLSNSVEKWPGNQGKQR